LVWTFLPLQDKTRPCWALKKDEVIRGAGPGAQLLLLSIGQLPLAKAALPRCRCHRRRY
jgi:hypothetical protein